MYRTGQMSKNVLMTENIEAIGILLLIEELHCIWINVLLQNNSKLTMLEFNFAGM